MKIQKFHLVSEHNFANYEVSRATPFNFFYAMTDSALPTIEQPYGVFASFPDFEGNFHSE